MIRIATRHDNCFCEPLWTQQNRRWIDTCDKLVWLKSHLIDGVNDHRPRRRVIISEFMGTRNHLAVVPNQGFNFRIIGRHYDSTHQRRRREQLHHTDNNRHALKWTHILMGDSLAPPACRDNHCNILT